MVQDAEEMVMDELMDLIGDAEVRFWQCPIHQGPPHKVQWREDIAHCMTCGQRSKPYVRETRPERDPVEQSVQTVLNMLFDLDTQDGRPTYHAAERLLSERKT